MARRAEIANEHCQAILMLATWRYAPFWAMTSFHSSVDGSQIPVGRPLHDCLGVGSHQTAASERERSVEAFVV